ncbi:hypothetical protein Purlil1_12644 [Purpureocillium lilacinum]|uniref:Uncharacterized protein n=1 Tax=Purpureocillium lilacinum TaxID=33203 RepID=A0ABR0BGD6_PURLI|nr:hypothetical protein Purlil1_12644 [Purpureocillium lilacinum]
MTTHLHKSRIEGTKHHSPNEPCAILFTTTHSPSAERGIHTPKPRNQDNQTSYSNLNPQCLSRAHPHPARIIFAHPAGTFTAAEFINVAVTSHITSLSRSSPANAPPPKISYRPPAAPPARTPPRGSWASRFPPSPSVGLRWPALRRSQWPIRSRIPGAGDRHGLERRATPPWPVNAAPAGPDGLSGSQSSSSPLSRPNGAALSCGQADKYDIDVAPHPRTYRCRCGAATYQYPSRPVQYVSSEREKERGPRNVSIARPERVVPLASSLGMSISGTSAMPPKKKILDRPGGAHQGSSARVSFPSKRQRVAVCPAAAGDHRNGTLPFLPRPLLGSNLVSVPKDQATNAKHA